jgi:hypothetical protein
MDEEIENVKNQRNELKRDLKNSKEDLKIVTEIEPLEIQRLKLLLSETKSLYDNLIRQYNIREMTIPSNKTREVLEEIYARKREDIFIEFEYIASRKDFYTPDEAISILSINPKEYEYELKNNPIRLLSIVFNNIDDKSRYILGRIMDKQQPNTLDIESLKQEYVSSTGEFYDKVVNVYFDKLVEINGMYKIDAIDKLIKVKPAIDEIIAGLLSLTTILSAGLDLSISIFRGFDSIVNNSLKEKISNENEIKKLEKTVRDLEQRKDKLGLEVETLTVEYNKASDKLKKIELKINEEETRMNIRNQELTNMRVIETQQLDESDNNGNNL